LRVIEREYLFMIRMAIKAGDAKRVAELKAHAAKHGIDLTEALKTLD
jgi:hypothetical protein